MSPFCSLEDLKQTHLEDDHVLLEEMALYQEGEGQEVGSDVGDTVGLSDSKNHDELMLQMEEFM